MERRKVILDLDGGLDGCLALALALRSPEIELLAVTVVAGAVPRTCECVCCPSLRMLASLR